jgi:hypothetical protein
MTRNALIGRVLAGILFAGNLGAYVASIVFKSSEAGLPALFFFSPLL